MIRPAFGHKTLQVAASALTVTVLGSVADLLDWPPHHNFGFAATASVGALARSEARQRGLSYALRRGDLRAP